MTYLKSAIIITGIAILAGSACLSAEDAPPPDSQKPHDEGHINFITLPNDGVKLLNVSETALELVRALKVVENAKATAKQVIDSGRGPSESDQDFELRIGTFKYFYEKLDW